MTELTRRAFLAATGGAAAAYALGGCGGDSGGGDTAATLQSSFDSLLDAAREEAGAGKFKVWAFSPSQDDTHKALFDAFSERWDIDVDGEWQSMLTDEAVTRIVTEADAGRASCVNGYGSEHHLLQFDSAELLKPFDWTGVFGEELPGIEDSAGAPKFEQLQGSALLQNSLIDNYVYNTKMISPDELPKSIEELAEPKWSGKFILSSGGTPFYLLALTWGIDKMLEVAEKIAANNPILKSDGSLVPQAVGAGEAPVGIGAIDTVERLKSEGSPLDWAVMAEGNPTSNVYQSILANAEQPNLGALFLAWLVTDGAPIYGEKEFMGRLNDPRWSTAKLMGERAPEAKEITPTKSSDLEFLYGPEGSLASVVKVFSGTGG